jgi:hypothetical protein
VYQGIDQPMRRLNRSICGWDARDTSATVVSRALMWARWPIWSVNIEQPSHGSPSGGNQKW